LVRLFIATYYSIFKARKPRLLNLEGLEGGGKDGGGGSRAGGKYISTRSGLVLGDYLTGATQYLRTNQFFFAGHQEALINYRSMLVYALDL
jgi:hypothetical protein